MNDKTFSKKDDTTAEQEIEESYKENKISIRVINDHVAEVINIKKEQ